MPRFLSDVFRGFRLIGTILWVSFFGGLFCGAAIGIVPVFLHLVTVSLDCTVFTADACPNGRCSVRNGTIDGGAVCGFNGNVTCVASWSKEVCQQMPGNQCRYDDTQSRCNYAFGWDALMTGVYAGALIGGAMLGAATSSTVLKRAGKHRMLLLFTVVALAGQACSNVGVIMESFAAFVVSRLVLGVGMGWVHVIVPVIVNEAVSVELRSTTSAVFQCMFASGILLVSLVGVAVDVSHPGTLGNVQWRQHILSVPVMLAAVALLAASRLAGVRRPPMNEAALSAVAGQSCERVASATNADEAPTTTTATTAQGTSEEDEPEPSFVKGLAVAVVLSAAQQLTGISSVAAYSPTFLRSLELNPLLSNFLLQLWNALMTMVSIPVSRRFNIRQMYLGALGIVVIALPIVGLATNPAIVGAHPTPFARAIAGLGLAVYIAAFAMGMAASFWSLATELFPTSQKALGCAITNTVQLTFAMILVVAYPAVTQALSGGANAANQQRGLSAVLFIFGGIAFGAWILLCRFMHPRRSDGKGKSTPATALLQTEAQGGAGH